jgi:hypothetical protein
MSEPIVFISNQRIKGGSEAGYKQNYVETVEWIKANRPRTVANLAYLSEDNAEASIVIVFPDAEAMELHMRGLGELPKRALGFMEITSLQIYGTPTEATMQIMKKIAGSGVALTIKSQPIGGYIRLKSE